MRLREEHRDEAISESSRLANRLYEHSVNRIDLI